MSGSLNGALSVDLCHLHRDHGDIRREAAEHANQIIRETLRGDSDIRREAAEHSEQIVREVLNSDANIRSESAAHTCEIVKEGLKGDFNTRGDIKDARYDLADRVGNSADRIVDRLSEHDAKVTDRFFTVGRDTQDIRAQIIAQQQQMVAGFATVAKDTEIASLKGMIEGQKNTAYLGDKIALENEKTRQLINELKNSDCNRMLIERNAEIVEHRHYGHHWQSMYGQNQWQNLTQQLANQTANFNSQLAEARQGMVNFGTMAGNAGQQTSTNNNVR